jgi:septal ring factor EnvC (AmiA/AmiB activator)
VSEEYSPEPETTQDEPVEEFEPITSQEDFNKRIGERLAGVKRKYADYDELKSKATEFDALQEASKSEVQKLQENYTTLQKELNTERRKAFAAVKGIPVAAVTGDTPEEWEAAAEALLAWRAEQEKPKTAKTTSSTTLKSGATGSDSRLDPQERAAAALRQMRHQ